MEWIRGPLFFHLIELCDEVYFSRICVSVEVNPETVEEKVARLELVLLNDLGALKHRQVIHPVLREGEFTQTCKHPSRTK